MARTELNDGGGRASYIHAGTEYKCTSFKIRVCSVMFLRMTSLIPAIYIQEPCVAVHSAFEKRQFSSRRGLFRNRRESQTVRALYGEACLYPGSSDIAHQSLSKDLCCLAIQTAGSANPHEWINLGFWLGRCPLGGIRGSPAAGLVEKPPLQPLQNARSNTAAPFFYMYVCTCYYIQ